MIIYDDIEQMSPEWFALKAGVPSASNADKILTPGGKLSTQSEGLINALIAERLGYADDPIEPTEWMLRGIGLEAEARDLFAFETGLSPRKVAWITNDAGTAGCSPDALADLRSVTVGIEIKCPKASTHIGYLRGDELPSYYAPQVHWSMAVTGLKEWYFMSYYPGLDPLIKPVKADEYTAKIAKAVEEFSGKLEAEAARFNVQIKGAA